METPNSRKGLVEAKRPFFAGALNRGICPRQDRPNLRPVLKLNNGVDKQVGSIRSGLVQSRYSEFYLYPLIITALNTLCRNITTNSLIPVTTPLATPVLGDVTVSL